jgi:hypothetical protein
MEYFKMKYYGMDGKPITLDEYAAYMKDFPLRQVGSTVLPGGVLVSTVLLCLDHSFGSGPPLIFETMVFGPGSSADLDCVRYATKEEAEAGHAAMVTKWTGWTPDMEEPLPYSGIDGEGVSVTPKVPSWVKNMPVGKTVTVSKSTGPVDLGDELFEVE